MIHRLKCGLFAASFLAAIGTVSTANAVDTVFISGNPTTCKAYATALLGLNLGYTFGTSFPYELRVTTPADGTYQTAVSSPLKITLTGLGGSSGTHFNWVETTSPTPKKVVDFVGVKAGNGRTVAVYFPDAASGTNLSDLNTTSKIGEIMFCGDNLTEVATSLPTCNLAEAELDTVCGALGPGKFFEVESPGPFPNPQQCACPPITAAACDFDPTTDLPDCTTVIGTARPALGALSGDQGIPLSGSTCTLKCYSFGATRTCVTYCVEP